MRFSIRTLLIVTAVFAICCGSAIFFSALLDQHATVTHQRAVTAQLTQWGKEYSRIDDVTSAIRATEMISYMQDYYVPSDGYRTSDELETKLQNARDSSIRQICDALERYTGRRFGNDPLAWTKWANSQKRLAFESGEK